MAKIQEISINLWFDTQAEAAAKYYTSIFKKSSIDSMSYYTEAGKEIHKMKPDSILTVEFTLGKQKFVGLNGGPVFKFNEAVSIVVNCETQDDVDYYWEKLKKGGDPKARQCGWLKDKYGVSWQVVPVILAKMMTDKNKTKVENVMAVMMQMKKLDIKKLEKAFNKK